MVYDLIEKKKQTKKKQKKQESKKERKTQLKTVDFFFLFNFLDITTVNILHVNLTFFFSKYVIVCIHL